VIAKGRKAISIACDVTDETKVTAAVKRAKETFGGVDILVNGATLFNTKGILDMSVEEWRRQTDVLLTGAFLFTKLIAKQMIELGRHGNMINIISTAGHQGEPGNIGYGTAKGGLLNFTRAVAMDLAEHGIRVNSLTPTATDRAEGLERAQRWGVEWPGPRFGQRLPGWPADPGAGLPMQKLPSPSHYGKAAAFLASDEAEMITGFDLRVDGGAIAKYWIWNPGS
jgi:NAD(P)-dependent dehydrogenase (short-subunit alcohol dehydrogenase family)